MQLLYSKIIGEGSPMIILHGFLGMSDNWKTLGMRYAGLGLQVHLLDQRNHGRSFHSDVFSYEAMAEDVFNYVRHHRLSPVIILGHSMGGKTAMQFATSYPNQVSKLIIADIAPRYYLPHHQKILEALHNLQQKTLYNRAEAERILACSITEENVRQFLMKNLYRNQRDQLVLRPNINVFINNDRAIGEALSDGLSFEGRVIFVKGERSDYIIETDFEEIDKCFPNAIIKTINEAGHWLHAEQPNVFFQITSLFISEK